MVDSQLADRAQTALEKSPYLPRRNLRLETEAGRITLKGVVTSYYQKQMAQETLRQLEGVDHIENHLEVQWS